MLEKGHDREAAEKEIGVLLALTRHLGETSLRLGHADGALNLRLEATLNAP
jgi:hypothetical protein